MSGVPMVKLVRLMNLLKVWRSSELSLAIRSRLGVGTRWGVSLSGDVEDSDSDLRTRPLG